MKTISTVKNLSKLAIVVSALAITVPLEARRGGSGGTCSEGYDAGTRQMQRRELQNQLRAIEPENKVTWRLKTLREAGYVVKDPE